MLKQAGISGGVSSELRSAAVKMLFVKEENTSEPETCRIKHEEPEPKPWRIKHEEPEPCRIKHEEQETEPEPRIIKHEEPEPRIIKHEDYGGWSLFFINNNCCTLGLQ